MFGTKSQKNVFFLTPSLTCHCKCVANIGGRDCATPEKRFCILKSCAFSLPFFFFWQSFEMRGESTLEARLGREREAILWGEASRGPPRQARVLAGGNEPFNIIKRNSKLWPQTFFVQWLFTWVRVSGLENTKSPSLQEQTVNTALFYLSANNVLRHCCTFVLCCFETWELY